MSAELKSDLLAETSPPESFATVRPSRPHLVVTFIWVVTIAAFLVGIAERAWYVFHRPVDSDEAIVGLMAQQILHGHFSAFYWGQSYGGGEPYLVAVVFGIFGSSAWALEAVPMLLSLAAAVVTWRVARRLVTDRAIPWLAGSLVWAGSQTAVSNSAIELGFRGVTLLCGLLALLLSLRLLDGDRSIVTVLGIGLASGIGWWSSPEIVYYLVPSVLLLVGAVVSDTASERLARWSVRGALAAAAAALGALPWLWDNVGTGFKSLRAQAFALPPQPLSYGGRLRVFFEYSFAVLVNLRKADNGRWIWSPPIIDALLGVAIAVTVGAVVACGARGGRHLALAVSAVAAPFLLALSPATWFWNDGRYADLLIPLLVLVGVSASGFGASAVARKHEPRSSSRFTARLTFAVLTAALVAFSAVYFSQYALHKTAYLAGWTDPNLPAERDVGALEAGRATTGFADYWVAYDFDFLSGGRLKITTAGSDPDRWTTLNAEVLHSAKPTWIFVRPDRASLSEFAGSMVIRGPCGLQKQVFLAYLGRQDISYSKVDVDAVVAIKPHATVLPTDGSPLLCERGL